MKRLIKGTWSGFLAERTQNHNIREERDVGLRYVTQILLAQCNDQISTAPLKTKMPVKVIDMDYVAGFSGMLMCQ